MLVSSSRSLLKSPAFLTHRVCWRCIVLDDRSKPIDRAVDIVRIQRADHGGSQIRICIAEQQVAENTCGRRILNLSGNTGQFQSHFGVGIFGEESSEASGTFAEGVKRTACRRTPG